MCSALVIVLFVVINMEYVKRTIEIFNKKTVKLRRWGIK